METTQVNLEVFGGNAPLRFGEIAGCKWPLGLHSPAQKGQSGGEVTAQAGHFLELQVSSIPGLRFLEET